MFEMKEEYKLGIELIDTQHAKLFEIGERAYNLLKDSYRVDKYDRIIEIIEELRRYTIIHFRDEEEYMDSINYKRLFTQKIDHAEFIKKINDVNLDKIDQNQDEYIMEILNIISKWLVEHIIEKDLLIVAK
ncbi:hemerythrin family protein [Clostridium bowmanii]|uniref:bacteriohemerythrin n=1 Tax=Clostridium bowmanii TaxID=132925 RepID=UPI001C0E4BE0|nr:hemerythrin family protein [Clostridium bowmanii]MBU3191881.1 hemerythrin family protein [Clostridium bowmanii]MCA1076127.1 hemerythrin family protein [Clostridium bowmanii]